MHENISQKLFILRTAVICANISEMAEATGLSRRTFRNIERGLTIPRTETLIQIALAYHISLDFIAGL